MAFKIPDVLRYEIRHFLEGFHGPTGSGGPRQWVNSHPLLIASVASLSIALVVLALVVALRPVSAPLMQGETAWFYDINTGKLFEGSEKETGPIAAPSGPSRKGGPAGFRAYVYSYILDPNESELFVGFLEQPDPDAVGQRSSSDARNFDEWARSRLIRRPGDKNWVQATSTEGKAILEEMVRPNGRRQVPIHQIPDRKE